MKKYIFIFLLVVSGISSLYSGNDRKIDSLLQFISRQAPDTLLVNALNDVGKAMIDFPDSSYAYVSSAFELAKKLRFESGQARSYSLFGEVYNAKGNYDLALKNLYSAYHLYEKLGNTRQMGRVMNSIGNTHLGNKDNEKALTAFKKCYSIGNSVNDSSIIALSSFGVGNIFGEMGKIDSAMKYLNYALPAFHKQGHTYAEGMTWTLIGQLKNSKKDFKGSLASLDKAMALFQKAGQAYGIGMTYQSMGKTYYDSGDKQKALENYLAAYEVHLSRNAYDNLKESCGNISEVYKDLGDYKNALLYHERFMMYKDSVFNDQSRKQLLEIETQYQTQDKEKELKIKSLALEKSNSEIRSRTFILFIFVGVSAVLLVMGFFIYRQYKQKKIANVRIMRQKDIIEEKNKNITDSIRYAQYIQSAILPDDDRIYQLMGESFVLYRPKDIVSGDFYWIISSGNYVYVAAVDCTGHGVPGAFMSIVGNNALTNAIKQSKEPGTDEILETLQNEVQGLFRHNYQSSTVRDGMDISLVRIDRKNMRLQYSGANSPLVYVREDVLTEIKADKFAISAYSEERISRFTLHEIDLKKGDAIYLFSDGYADQFGGPKGKKLKYKQFQEILLTYHTLPMVTQKALLHQTIEEWRGMMEQIDDILVIGFRI